MGFVIIWCCLIYNFKLVLLMVLVWYLKYINWKDFLVLFVLFIESGLLMFCILDWYLRILFIWLFGCIMYSCWKVLFISLVFWRFIFFCFWIVWLDMWVIVELCLCVWFFLKKVFNFIYIFIFVNILFGFLLILI